MHPGVEDDGYPRGLNQGDMEVSLATLQAMAEEVHAATTLLRKAPGTRKRQCAIVRVHKLCVDGVSYTDLRIAGASACNDAFADWSCIRHVLHWEPCSLHLVAGGLPACRVEATCMSNNAYSLFKGLYMHQQAQHA